MVLIFIRCSIAFRNLFNILSRPFNMAHNLLLPTALSNLLYPIVAQKISVMNS
jgi:hypothetical protein